MKFSSRVVITIIWRDARLVYKNLGDHNILDEKDVNAMWKPPLILSNSLDLASIIENKYLLIEVEKQGQGVPENEKVLYEGMTYNGNENDLVMSAKIDNDFACSYQLHNYPFDSQICSIDISSPDNILHDIKLIPGKITYSGPNESLPQFEFYIGNVEANDEGSTIRGLIHLKRNPRYHILCTYLPTVCIILMAIITMFIDESHFEATIMVALTAMLVLYTLFQSISDNMPTTAYLKLLDVWLIFGLGMPFLIFIVEVTWELMQQKENNDVKEMYSITNSVKTKCKICFQIGIPVVCLVFSILYVIIVFVKYYE